MSETKRIALTFDDGPSPYTGRLLDILKRHGCRATFFLVGDAVAADGETVKRAALEGHELGNHTMSHGPLNYMTDGEIRKELSDTSALIASLTGKAPTLCRPPYGAFDEKVGEAGLELGIAFINWSLDTRDWDIKDAEAVFKAISENACCGDIILCHDSHKTTVDAMEKAVPYLLSEGYELVSVSELLEEPCPGKLYYRKEYET